MRQTVSSQSTSGSPIGNFLLSLLKEDDNSARDDKVDVLLLPEHLHLTLVPGGEELLAAHLPLADKEKKIITVYGSICLEQEVSDKQICPVGGVVCDCKARVLKLSQNINIELVFLN